MGENTVIRRWLPEEEAYLYEVSKTCETLSTKYKYYYEVYKKAQARFKIPSIVISSVTGLTSFLGTSDFPEQMRNWIPIAVGISSLFIAILNSIESYMKIGETMSGCLQASISLQKLKETIDLELSVPPDDRNDSGIIFVRECHSKYEKILELSPHIIKNIKFIKPIFDTKHPMTLTNKPPTTNSRDVENGMSEIFEETSPSKPKTIILA